MSTLAVVVDWGESPGSGPGTPAGTARRMVDCLRDRAPDGLAELAAPGAGLAIGKLVVAHKQGHAAQPLVDQEAQLYVVADVRIDNRADLQAQLALPQATTDAEIVLAGYRRWGRHLPEHLVGDFAFVVWDARARTLFAARDPFGVRPLVYRQLPHRLLVASDVEQILEVDPSAWAVDDHAVVDYLVSDWRFADRTFFEPIKALPAGHCLQVNERAASVLRWWFPPATRDEISDREECHREFRRLLFRAVADRLDSDHPVALQISGGFDSSSIAVVAAQLGARVPLRGVGAIYPGLECDEQRYMDALKAQLPFPVEYWDGTQVVLDDFLDPALSGPGRRGMFNDGSRAGLDIVAREGARVIISGHGGDLWGPTGQNLPDFLRHRRWRQLWEMGFMRPNRSWRKRLGLLRASLPLLVPEPVSRLLKAVRPGRAAPAWATPTSQAALALEPSADPWLRRLPLRGDRRRVADLAAAQPVSVMDLQQICASRARAELRFPFADTRLMALLWRFPLAIWDVAGYTGRLHARILRDLLPREIATREKKTLFESAIASRRAASWAVLEDILKREPSLRSRYVRKEASAVDAPPLSPLNVGTLEAWLKMIYGRAAALSQRENH